MTRINYFGYAALYIGLYVLTVVVSNVNLKTIDLGPFKISNLALSGLLTDIEMILSILLVVNTGKYGFRLSLWLNCFSLFGVIASSITRQTTNYLAGIMTTATSLVIIIILHGYKNHLQREKDSTEEQREKLADLYSQLKDHTRILESNEQRLEALAHYDVLTGLENRKKIIDRLNSITSQKPESIGNFAVVFIDLDDFKKVNDTLGHQAGDLLLQKIVTQWKLIIHDDDVLGRLGGDEFALIVQSAPDLTSLNAYVERLHNILMEIQISEYTKIPISASFGISRYPEHGQDPSALLKSADIAMYNAKQSGKNRVCFFSPDMQEFVTRRIKIETGLRQAIGLNQIYLVYQPQFFSATGQVRGFEVLVRWNSDELGEVRPDIFIPVAEESDLIVDIGIWILELALRNFQEFRKTSRPGLIMSVNISVRQILSSLLTETISRLLEETGTPPEQLELEVTESIFINYPDRVIAVLKELKGLGVRLALDDFGTGYASLGYLQMFPLDTLKIDKFFIDEITSRNESRELVGSVIDLAHKQGFRVIAEGVETDQQLDLLVKMNCDCIQGYLLSRPVDAEKLAAIITAGDIG